MKNRSLRRETLREELKSREYLRQLEEISRFLRRHWKDISSEQTAALRLRAEINFKRLAKVLPDARELHISGSIEQTHRLVSVSEAQTRIAELTSGFIEGTVVDEDSDEPVTH